MEQEIVTIIKPFLATSPLAVAVIVVINYLHRSGILSALASRFKKNGGGDDKRVTDLENWKEVAETNHFNDLEDLKLDMKDLKKQVNEMDKRLAVVEARQLNSRH